MNETLYYIAEEISEIYDIDINEAIGIVNNSFVAKVINDVSEYVQHYDAEYWAKEIMESIVVK